MFKNELIKIISIGDTSLNNKQPEPLLRKNTPLHHAVLNGDLITVKKLQKNKFAFNRMLIYMDYNDNLPLDRAAARGHYEIVKILIEAHQTVPLGIYIVKNRQRYSALLSAIRWYLKVLDNTYANKKLIGVFNTGKNRDTDYFNIITLLIENYPEQINYSDNKGCLPIYYVIHHLHDAIKNNKQVDLVNKLAILLIKSGASLDKVNHLGISSRSLARRLDMLPILQDIEGKIKIILLKTETWQLLQEKSLPSNGINFFKTNQKEYRYKPQMNESTLLPLNSVDYIKKLSKKSIK